MAAQAFRLVSARPTVDVAPAGRTQAETPALARGLDLVAIAAVALALAVYHFGGWRIREFGLVLSLRSWERPFAWAIVAATLRHVFVPQPSLPRRLRDAAVAVERAFMRSTWSPALSAAATPVALSRAVVYGVGLFAVAAIGLEEGATVARGGWFIDLLLRWDAQWYSDIARHGYSWNGNPLTENPVVFFPAYPMLMRAGAWLTGAHPVYVGFAISMLAFWFAMAYVYRMAREQFGFTSPGIVLSLMAWYPFALFYGGIYTESLFLLALAGTFYHARNHQRAAAAGWALVVSLTKPNGFVVAAPLALMFVLRAWRESGGRPASMDARAYRGLAADALVVCVPVAGVAAYSAYLWGLTGDPLAWLHGQLAWGRAFHGPLALLHVLQSRLGDGVAATIMMSPTDVLNAAAAVFALLSIVPIFFRLGAPYALLVALMTIPPLLAGGTTSMGRFTSSMFPMFIWLGGQIPASMRAGWCAAFASGQAFAATLFFTWRQLY